MGFKLLLGGKGGVWRNDSPKDLELMTKYDKIVLLVAAITFVISVAAMVYLVSIDVEFLTAAMVITVPFFVLGLIWYYHSRKWLTLVVVLAISVGLYLYAHLGLDIGVNFLIINDILIFVMDFIFIGSVGVVALVSSFQRLIFYRIIAIVEFMNVKEKMTLTERLIAFFFNIPNDLDTRNLTLDYNLKRASIPWSEIRSTMIMGLMVGIFLWIYVSMSPKFSAIASFSDIPIYVFAVVLYIPVIVMPWSIFNALHVRIETKYRDFELYNGITGTIKRMILPVFAALIYVLIAIRDNDFGVVASFIVTSIVVIVLVIALTSALYYYYFENKLVDDIVSKWKVFRPVSLMMSVSDEKGKKKEYPGTPKRDMNDFGEFVFEK